MTWYITFWRGNPAACIFWHVLALIAVATIIHDRYEQRRFLKEKYEDTRP